MIRRPLGKTKKSDSRGTHERSSCAYMASWRNSTAFAGSARRRRGRRGRPRGSVAGGVAGGGGGHRLHADDFSVSDIPEFLRMSTGEVLVFHLKFPPGVVRPHVALMPAGGANKMTGAAGALA